MELKFGKNSTLTLRGIILVEEEYEEYYLLLVLALHC